MNKTSIEYLTHTWNPCVGCSGEGCAVRVNCWARAMAKRLKHRCFLCYTFSPHFHPERLEEPLHRKKSSRIGVALMGDLFDRYYVTYMAEAIRSIFDVMDACMHPRRRGASATRNPKVLCEECSKLYPGYEVVLDLKKETKQR